MTIKAIIFDIGGVLMNYDHWKAARPMSKLLGISSKTIYQIISNKGSHPGFTKLCETKASEKEYWRHAAKKWKLDFKKFPIKKMDSLWNKIFWPNKPALKLIKKLKKNYKLGLLSNMGRGHVKYLKTKYNITNPFNVNVFSSLVGMRKPNPKIYKLILKKLKVKPNEAVFLDDLKKNVNGARRVGLNAIQFKSLSQAFKELKKLGVK